MKSRNLTLLLDLYELTMANGFFEEAPQKRGYFDLYFRKIPDKGGLVIYAGLAQVIQYLNELHFSESDLDYLKKLEIFSPNFLEYLRTFKFECDVWSVEEGTPVFPNEPLITVRGPLVQVQLLETMLLNIVNHESLIATKARRICMVARGRSVMEFGSRRAQGADAATYGARAAVIGGCSGTANVLSAKLFGLKPLGTMAHSWIQSFSSEKEAFMAWKKIYPHNCLLLVDTYDVLHSGVLNALEVFKQLKEEGIQSNLGIRIDSGDITYLTKQARRMLDDAGFKDATITVSNALDEDVIQNVLEEGASIDSFGVGEKLITASSDPVLSGVYKLVATQENGEIIPKIKLSNTVEKTTIPGFKNLYRLYDDDGQARGDLLTLDGEKMRHNSQLFNADPNKTYQKKKLRGLQLKPLRVQVFAKGKLVYQEPETMEIQRTSQAKLATLPAACLRLKNPDIYDVYWTRQLKELRTQMIEQYSE
ncbi:nicotinate phosphoribosyltransferase [Liquorilactobacillus satsumensis]|uniref:Nicotinate phosphoribosyltransferase n=1 Tax=Liquorilactobacillus satsumensis DSM 16230 = JCM 12392 TaxID=1423801 RepID=A0A0R1V3Q8_9LACO|nr:nicotinate phosphoribosyltransferase [Liquorilactobacillus satsumensis]KRM00193.1 nicotinate phosphoribosyltransferase [Liquorilactobacillus satsumensis DSM 16230 = JCM 12392]MCC7665754.1 nicotinate phosphoribosyltransferase [Liquorilactobacillus satsumensis]MCP9328232.1 nicotinate phosphoribosyltransferase [Liquorilactobacillus satsumensis]MCP9356451.1 nicotinate phosphoribosyltransferase [Liquorilactobacillus satsumensis]MCP9370410.1 nicotinate phosphoribosyltransferase [Liquorilactobacil